MYHAEIKKAEPFNAYFQSEVPPSTLHVNKQMKVHAPNERELSSAYSHVLQIGGFQIERIRAKAQISLISIGMETLFQMFFVLN